MNLFGESVDSLEEKTATESPDLPQIEPTEEGAGQSPRQTFLCLGHEAQERQILDALNAGTMPHGLIFSGPEGIGKATFAFRLARFLLGRNRDVRATGFDMDPSDPVCRKIASGAHPDLLTIERAYDTGKDRYKDSVAVEDIRKVAPFLRMTASQGGWRIVIIDDADTMNRSAQNALLKILEEPPANTLLILIAHCMGTMVPTIRSRCRVISFRAPGRADFEAVLRRLNPGLYAPHVDLLFAMTEGSIGNAQRRVIGGGLDMPGRLAAILEKYPAWPWTEIHALADDLTRSGRDGAYESFKDSLLWLFRQSIVCIAKEQAMPALVSESGDPVSFMRHSSLATLMKICENLETHFDTVHRTNLDKRQAVFSAFHLISASNA